MTKFFVSVPITIVLVAAAILAGLQMMNTVPAASAAANNLMKSAPAAQAVTIQMPSDSTKFSDRELNGVEKLIMGILMQNSGPDEVFYGIRKGGRVLFSKTVPVPLGGTNRTYNGTYIAVFGVKAWKNGTPTSLGFAIEISGPHIGNSVERMKYCAAYRIFPYPSYDKGFDEPDPANQGWDRGPCM